MATKTSAKKKRANVQTPSRGRLALFVVLIGLIIAVGYLFVRTDAVPVQVGSQTIDYRCGAAAVDLLLERPRDLTDLGLQHLEGEVAVSGLGTCGDNAFERLRPAALILLASVIIAALIARQPVVAAVALIAAAVIWGLERFDSYPLALGLAIAVAILAAVLWLVNDD